MKKIILLVSILVLFGCGGGNKYLPPESEKISSISDTSKCIFIKNDFVETMRADKKIYYVQLRTYNAGGDSYKILSTNDENVPGMQYSRTYMVNFEVYKCK